MLEYSLQDALNELAAQKDSMTLADLNALIDKISIRKNDGGAIVDFSGNMTTCLKLSTSNYRKSLHKL